MECKTRLQASQFSASYFQCIYKPLVLLLVLLPPTYSGNSPKISRREATLVNIIEEQAVTLDTKMFYYDPVYIQGKAYSEYMNPKKKEGNDLVFTKINPDSGKEAIALSSVENQFAIPTPRGDKKRQFIVLKKAPNGANEGSDKTPYFASFVYVRDLLQMDANTKTFEVAGVDSVVEWDIWETRPKGFFPGWDICEFTIMFTCETLSDLLIDAETAAESDDEHRPPPPTPRRRKRAIRKKPEKLPELTPIRMDPAYDSQEYNDLYLDLDILRLDVDPAIQKKAKDKGGSQGDDDDIKQKKRTKRAFPSFGKKGKDMKAFAAIGGAASVFGGGGKKGKKKKMPFAEDASASFETDLAGDGGGDGGLFGGVTKSLDVGGFAKGTNIFKSLKGKSNPLSAVTGGEGGPLGAVAGLGKSVGVDLDAEGTVGGVVGAATGLVSGVTGEGEGGVVGGLVGAAGEAVGGVAGAAGVGGEGEGGGGGGLSGLLGKFGGNLDVVGDVTGAVKDVAGKGLGDAGLGPLNPTGLLDLANKQLGVGSLSSGLGGIGGLNIVGELQGSVGGLAKGIPGLSAVGDISGGLGGLANLGLGDAGLGPLNIGGIADLGLKQLGVGSVSGALGGIPGLSAVADIQGGFGALGKLGLGDSGLGSFNIKAVAELGLKQLGVEGVIAGEGGPLGFIQTHINPIAVISGLNPLGSNLAGLGFAELSLSSPISTITRLTGEGFGVKGSIKALFGSASGSIEVVSDLMKGLSAGISTNMIGSLTNGGEGGIMDSFGGVVSGVLLGGTIKGLGPLEISAEILGPAANFLDPVNRIIVSANAIANGIPGIGGLMGHQVTGQISGVGDFLNIKGMLQTMGLAPVLDIALGLSDSVLSQGESLISSFDIMGNGLIKGAAEALVQIGFPPEFANLAALGAHISFHVELLKWKGSSLGVRLRHDLLGASLNGGKHRSGGAGPKGDTWKEWKEWEQTGGTPPTTMAMYGITYSGAGNGRDFFFPLQSLVRAKFKLTDGKATLPGFFRPGVIPGEFDIFYPDNPDNAPVLYNKDGVMIPESYKQPNRDASFGIEGRLEDWNLFRASSPSKMGVYHEEDGKASNGFWAPPETMSKAPLRPVRSKSGMPIYYGYLFHGIRDSPHVFVTEGDGLTGFFVPDDEEQRQHKDTPRGVLFPQFPSGHAVFSLENVQDFETVKELRGAFLPDASNLAVAIGGRISRPENGTDFNFVMDRPAVDFVYVKGDPAMANIWAPFLTGEEWKYTPPNIEKAEETGEVKKSKARKPPPKAQPSAPPEEYQDEPPANTQKTQARPTSAQGRQQQAYQRQSQPPSAQEEEEPPPPPPPPAYQGRQLSAQGNGRQTGYQRQPQSAPPADDEAPEPAYAPPPPPSYQSRQQPAPRGRQQPGYQAQRQPQASPPPEEEPPPSYQARQPQPNRGSQPEYQNQRQQPPPPAAEAEEGRPNPQMARGRQFAGGAPPVQAAPPPPQPQPDQPPPVAGSATVAEEKKVIEYFGTKVVSQKTESFLPEKFAIDGVFIPHGGGDPKIKLLPFAGKVIAGKPNTPWVVNVTERNPQSPPIQKPLVCLFQPIGFPKEDAFIGVVVLNPQNTFGQVQFTDKQKQTEHFWTPGQEVWTPHGFAEKFAKLQGNVNVQAGGRRKRHAGREREEQQQAQDAMVGGKVPGLSDEHVDPPERQDNYYFGPKHDGSAELQDNLLTGMPRKFHYGYWHMDEGSPGPLFIPEVGALVIFAPGEGNPAKGYYFPKKPGAPAQVLFEGAVADGAVGVLFTANLKNEPSKEFVRAAFRTGTLQLFPDCEIIPGWKYATTKVAELPKPRMKELKPEHTRPSRRDLKYKLVGVGGGFSGVVVEGPEALDDANNPIFQEFLHYKAHRDGDVNPWGDVVVLDPIHRQLSPDGKTPGMGSTEPVLESAKQIAPAILAQFYLSNWEWPLAMEVDSVAGLGKPASTIKLAEKGNIVNMMDFRMYLMRKYACKRSYLTATRTVTILTPFGAERFFNLRKPAQPGKEYLDELVASKLKLLMPRNEGLLGWFSAMHNLDINDLMNYMKRKPSANKHENEDPNKPEAMDEILENWKAYATSPSEPPPEWAMSAHFKVWGDEHMCDEIVLDEFEIVQAGANEKKLTGVQLGYQLTADQGSKMSWPKIAGKLLKSVDKKRSDAPGEVLDDMGTTDLTGSVKKQMKGNVARRRHTQVESGEQGQGEKTGKSRRKREAERVRRELKQRRRRKRSAVGGPGDALEDVDDDDGTCRNKPGWRTQFKHNFVENVTLSGEGVIFYGFGNCKQKGIPNLKLLETRQPSNVIEYYLKVLRVDCMQDARERVLQLFNERLLEFGSDKMFFELPKTNPTIQAQKLLPDDIKKLSVAFELSAFAKTYHKLRTTGYPVNGFLREPNCIMTRSIGFLTEMTLFYITKARRLVATHSVRLTRNLLKTLRTALTKLHQDELILEHRCKKDGCPLDIALVEGDMFRVVSLIQFIVHGLRPYQRGHMDIKVSFYEFVGENKPAIKERIAEFKRQYKMHSEH